MIHVSGHDRLMALVPVIHDETRADRPGRELILQRLLEVLLIEALRSGPTVNMPPGLLRGLSDPQLAAALQRIHADAGGEISVSGLAQDAGMSRSGFFEKFRKEIGRAPMEYVTDWRMAIAKTLLRQGKLTNTEIALRVGYGSASAFGWHLFGTRAFLPVRLQASKAVREVQRECLEDDSGYDVQVVPTHGAMLCWDSKCEFTANRLKHCSWI